MEPGLNVDAVDAPRMPQRPRAVRPALDSAIPPHVAPAAQPVEVQAAIGRAAMGPRSPL